MQNINYYQDLKLSRVCDNIMGRTICVNEGNSNDMAIWEWFR